MASRMTKKTRIIVAIVIVAVVALVAIVLSLNSSSPSDLTLSIITWNETTLSALEGTPVVLVFWTTRCPHCPTELQRLETVAQQCRGEIKVIAINIGESVSRIQKFFDDYEPTMTVALDENGEAFVDYCREYGNPGYIPFTLFVDSEGMVKYGQVGAFRSETELWNTLNSILGITVPQTS